MSRALALLVALPLAFAAGVPVAQAAATVPVPVVKKLPNGLRVVVFPRPGSGYVQFQIHLPAGTAAESESQRGVAPLVAQMLRMGTSSRSPESFAEDVERLGGTFASAATRENAAVGIAVLPADFEAGLELMSDAVLNPIFDDFQVARLRDQAVRELVRLHVDPVATAEEQLWPFAWPGLGAARPPLGDLTSLFALNREALRTFHRDHYRPDHAVLAIAGDVTAEKAVASAEEWFGRWAGTRAAVEPPAAPAVPAGIRILLVDRPDLGAANVRLGWKVPGRDAADELARTMAVSLFDDRLRSRLAPRLPRDAGVAVGYGQLRSAGLLDVRFTVPFDSVTVAIDRARRAVRQARDLAVESGPFESLRDQLRASYPLRFATPGSIVSQWLSAEADDSDPLRRLESYPDRLAALDAAALPAALKRDWDLDRTAIVVLGPAARLREPLARLGNLRVVKLDEPPEPSAAAPDTLPPPTDAERRLGRERVDKAVAAHGGLQALKGIRDIVSEARVRIVLQGRELNGELRQLRKEPMRMVYLTRFEAFESRQVLNGDRAWSVDPTGALQAADSAGVAALQAGFSADVPHLLLAAADSTTRLVARGTVRVGERDLWAVDMTPAQGPGRRLYLDPETAELAGMDQVEEGPRGGSGVARRLYKDLRPVLGIRMPFEEERQVDGVTVMNVYVSRLQVNAGISDDEFVPPAGMPVTPDGR